MIIRLGIVLLLVAFAGALANSRALRLSDYPHEFQLRRCANVVDRGEGWVNCSCKPVDVIEDGKSPILVCE